MLQLVLPMGVSGAPAIAQAFLNKCLRVPYDGPGPMHGKIALGNICICFMDDLLTFGKGDCLAHYDAFVLKVLARHGIGANPKKCAMGRDRLSFVGHFVDGLGLHGDPAKTKAVREMPMPKDKQGIRRLMGMAGYLRRFMKDFGSNTVNLTTCSRTKAASTNGGLRMKKR